MTSAAAKSHVKSWLCYTKDHSHMKVWFYKQPHGLLLKRRLQLWVLLSGALPVGLRQSERSGAAPWWRWSTEQPADDRTSAGKCCCILDDPGRGTGRRSTDPSSVNRRVTKHLTSQSCFSFKLLLFRSSETQTKRAADLELCEYPSGFLQDGVHTVCHRHGVLPVVVGHTAVVLPYRHGEPTQLFQLEAMQKTRRIKINHPELRWRTDDGWPSVTLPGLPTGVVNHVDKDSRPDLLKGINVKVEPGGGRRGGQRWEGRL